VPRSRGEILASLSRVLVLLVMVVTMACLSPAFLTTGNMLNVLRQAAPIFVLAAGQMLVILARGIDLSMDSVAALSGVVVATMLEQEMPVAAAMVTGLAIGAVLGLLNGLVVTKIKLPPFVTTFGTLLLFKGLTVLYIDGKVIWGFPEAFRFFGAGRIGAVPAVIFVALAIFACFHVLLRYTTFGRKLYAIGANPEASRVSGIKIDRLLVAVYVISGVLAAFACELYISRLNSAKSDIGEGFSMDAIAATLIGGTSFEGGIGTIEGTLTGALIIILLRNAMNLLGISPLWHGFVTGAVMVLAVIGDGLLRRAATRHIAEPHAVREAGGATEGR